MIPRSWCVIVRSTGAKAARALGNQCGTLDVWVYEQRELRLPCS
jgi:hypothetical protein